MLLDDATSQQAWNLLAHGDYAEGWKLLETRSNRSKPQLKQMPWPEWSGEPLEGKRILIWAEQGFGDQIMLCRFARRLGASKVTIACAPQLGRLMGQVADDVLVFRGERVKIPVHDYWSLPFSLPHHLGVTPDTIPGAPYLKATDIDRRGKIGVMWRGEPANPNDSRRSLPSDLAAELLRRPDAISLHPDDTGARDFQDTANIIAGLDLVISVDTAVAHLAGAMGARCWLLLPKKGLDWRWMTERRDSPWYPSMTLFRQATAGDWRGVVDEITRQLREPT